MPAMIMPFPVKDDQMLKVAAPGDEVTATLVFTRDNRYWLENLVVTHGAPESARPSARPSPREPVPGAAVPDVALVNQDGKRSRLADYRGRVLALTFIYTRCPLPWPPHVPQLPGGREDPGRRARPPGAHPPDLDQLRSGARHPGGAEALRPRLRGGRTIALRALGVRLGPDSEIRKLGGFLGLDYDPDQGMWVHNLRTAVVGPDGTLVRSIRGSDWKAEELVADLRAAAGAAKRSEGRRP
jgi:protein SCO1/2